MTPVGKRAFYLNVVIVYMSGNAVALNKKKIHFEKQPKREFGCISRIKAVHSLKKGRTRHKKKAWHKQKITY